MAPLQLLRDLSLPIPKLRCERIIGLVLDAAIEVVHADLLHALPQRLLFRLEPIDRRIMSLVDVREAFPECIPVSMLRRLLRPAISTSATGVSWFI